MPSVVSEASVSPHRAHHGAKQASSKGSKQAGGFEALLDTTVPDVAPEKAPRADKPEKAERAASSRGANEPDSEPSDLASAAETDAAPEATESADGTDAEPGTETEVTALPTEIDTTIGTSQPDENAAVVAAVIVQPTSQPVVAPVIAPAVTIATATAAEDATTDIPLTGVKPAGETTPTEPTKAAPPVAPVDAAAPDQAAPQEIKPQTDKASTEKSAADKSTTDKPAADKVKVQPVADENASGAKDKDGSLAEKKTASEAPAIAKPETPAKPKIDAETTRSELDLTPHEHAAKTNTDTAQTATLLTTQTQAPQTATMSPATQQTAIAVPVAGLALEIAAQSRAGKSRFEIRLDPPELGRIDVRLDMDKDGNVTSRMIVERSETLDLLRRDAQQLERMLNQAGLKTADNALEFQLRDQGFAQNGDNSRNNNRDASQIIIPDDQSPVVDAARGYGRLLGLGNGLDISV